VDGRIGVAGRVAERDRAGGGGRGAGDENEVRVESGRDVDADRRDGGGARGVGDDQGVVDRIPGVRDAGAVVLGQEVLQRGGEADGRRRRDLGAGGVAGGVVEAGGVGDLLHRGGERRVDEESEIARDGLAGAEGAERQGAAGAGVGVGEAGPAG
jgi:hypothetical protein